MDYTKSDDLDIKILERWKNGDNMIKEDHWHVQGKVPTCYGAWVYAQAQRITIETEEVTHSLANKTHNATCRTTTGNTHSTRIGAGSHKIKLIAKWFAFRNSIRHHMTRNNNNE